MHEPNRARILFVDDEPLILESLERQLRDHYDVTLASGGKEAMRLVASQRPFAVVVVDLRMPGMDGNALLFCLRNAAPDTVRVLLTGHADVEAAVSAVNLGNIFRFLTKPCPAGTLLRALEDCVEEHRRVTSERLRNKTGGEVGQHDVRENPLC